MRPTNRVLLIHGIWNHRSWLKPLAGRLSAAGFTPHIFSYDSIWRGPDAALPALLETIERQAPDYLVGHSLGGLLALEALTQSPGLPVKRVVCLGSPLRGSFTARHLAGRPLLRHALGRSSGLLTRGFEAWHGSAEVGMVAGTRRRGLGQLVAPLQGESDGTVLLDETRLPGISAHCCVPFGHTELALTEEPARRAAQFLRTGKFEE